MGALQIKPYSDRAVIVTGDTKPHKDRIKSAVPKAHALWRRQAEGWIFSRRHEQALRDALADLLGDAPAPTRDSVSARTKRGTTVPRAVYPVQDHPTPASEAAGDDDDLPPLDLDVAALVQQQHTPAPADPPTPEGPAGAAISTARGTRVSVRYDVIEAADLVCSHTTDGAVNPAYPVELQPRDRSRVASGHQVQAMAAHLDPARLGQAPDPGHGAPVVGPDGVVESGNGRVLAIGLAYRRRMADAYRAMVASTVPGKADGMTAPVLVRVRTDTLPGEARARFCREANEADLAAYSATEQAQADADGMDGLLDLFSVSEDGRIDHAGNRDFIGLFVSRVVGVEDQGTVLDASGRVSQQGLARIRNAVFWAAYGDPDALARLAESTDNGIRNVTAGLLRAAPAMARVRQRAADGRLYPLDVSASAARAAEEYAALRARGEYVADVVAQPDILGQRYDDTVLDLMGLYEEHRRSGKRIGDALVRYCELVEEQGSPNQSSMWGLPDVPSVGELLDLARQSEQAAA